LGKISFAIICSFVFFTHRFREMMMMFYEKRYRGQTDTLRACLWSGCFSGSFVSCLLIIMGAAIAFTSKTSVQQGTCVFFANPQVATACSAYFNYDNGNKQDQRVFQDCPFKRPWSSTTEEPATVDPCWKMNTFKSVTSVSLCMEDPTRDAYIDQVGEIVSAIIVGFPSIIACVFTVILWFAQFGWSPFEFRKFRVWWTLVWAMMVLTSFMTMFAYHVDCPKDDFRCDYYATSFLFQMGVVGIFVIFSSFMMGVGLCLGHSRDSLLHLLSAMIATAFYAVLVFLMPFVVKATMYWEKHVAVAGCGVLCIFAWWVFFVLLKGKMKV